MNPLSPTELASRIAQRRQQAAACGHRAVAVLSGEAAWCRQQALSLLARPDEAPALWIGREQDTPLPVSDWGKARHWLGSELSLLVVDAHDGFDADGFAALSGTLRAGGLLLLLIPPLKDWGEHADPQQQRFLSHPYQAEAISGYFLHRLARSLSTQTGFMLWQQGQKLPATNYHCSATPPRSNATGPYAHLEQQQAVAAIHHVLHGHRRRPLLITADRGRGKSAALGIAAAELLQQGLGPILLTAPSLDAASQVFVHARRILPDAHYHRGELQWQGQSLRFVAPDALLRETPPDARLLLVDEAAAIPLAMLNLFLRQYARLVFATTVHGYEGSGRGFLLRFARQLEQQAPGWQGLEIQQAIRWADGDPLEAWCQRALMLDAEAVDAAALVGWQAEQCAVEFLQREALAEDEDSLRALFGLLQQAHYRTRPNDLRQLLDGPELELVVIRWQGHIIATALLAREGGLDDELAEAIYRGERRLRGHLLPQSLAVHAGFAEAATLHAIRIVRLAVHPTCQRQGLGSRLLEAIRTRHAEADYLGVSFGASPALLAFWQQAGMAPVRIGLKREASSGSHALMLMQALSPSAKTLFSALRTRFCQQLPLLLSEPLQQLEADQALPLLHDCRACQPTELEAQDWRDIHSFAHGKRGYEVCMAALRKLVLNRDLGALAPPQQALLLHKVIQQQGWPACIRQLNMQGHQQAETALREAIGKLIQCDGDHGRQTPSGPQ